MSTKDGTPKARGEFSTRTISGSLDKLRQGTSHTRFTSMFRSALPVIGLQTHNPLILVGPSGSRYETQSKRYFDDSNIANTSGSNDLPDGQLEWRPNFRHKDSMVLGISKTHRNETVFEDMPKFNPKSYIEDEGDSMIYPYILWNVSMKDPYQMNGVLEPLTIRDEISFSTTWQASEEPRSIKGSLQSSAATNARGEAVPMQQFFRPYTEESVGPYEDPPEHFANPTTYGPQLPGYLNDQRMQTQAFEDAIGDREEYLDNAGVIRSSTDATDSNDTLTDRVIEMSPPTGGMLPRDHVSAHAGFQYQNNPNGTDSITYGDRTN